MSEFEAKFVEVYKKRVWTQWEYPAGDLSSLRKADHPIPPGYGVYIFRSPKPLCRVRGKSDVVYIGQAGGWNRSGKQGIAQRVFNTQSESAAWVRKAIEKLFQGKTFVFECSCTSEHEDPKVIENKLLCAYRDTHLEIPPANHQSPKCIQ